MIGDEAAIKRTSRLDNGYLSHTLFRTFKDRSEDPTADQVVF